MRNWTQKSTMKHHTYIFILESSRTNVKEPLFDIPRRRRFSFLAGVHNYLVAI